MEICPYQYNELKQLLLLGLILPLSFANAQAQVLPDSVSGNDTSLSYIDKEEKRMNLKLSLDNDIKRLTTNNVVYYDIRENSSRTVNLAVNYRWLSFSVGFSPRFFPGNNDNDIRGRTRSLFYNTALNFSRWQQRFAFSKVKGYYLQNTSDYRANWIEGTDPYIQFPDLQYTSFYGQTAYQFNRNFSMGALTSQTQRQLRSAGTFLPVFSYHYYVINDKTPLNGQNSSQRTGNWELLLSAGYYYTYVINKKFYAAAGILPGAGLIFTTLMTRMPSGTIYSRYSNAVFRLDGTGELGYNSDHFFTGVRLGLATVGYRQRGVANVISRDEVSYQIFIGYRFDFLRGFDGWWNEKLRRPGASSKT